MNVTILDLTRLLPGGFATHLLQDMGARIIKVEEPKSGDYLRDFPFPLNDGMSAYFHAINRGKESIVLDLKKTPKIFLDLASRVDIVLEGFRPGVMERLGVGYKEVAKRNKNIIYCSLSGYSRIGSYNQRPGHDLNYLSLTGFMDLQRGQDGQPTLPAFQIADIAAGSLFVVTRILQALIERQTAGVGTHLELSILEGAAALMSFTASPTIMTNATLASKELLLNGQVACYNLYPTADNRWMSVANLEKKFWITFCDVLEKPEWIDKQFDRSKGFHQEISQVFRSKTSSAWVQTFLKCDTCVELVRTLEEAAQDGIFKYSNQEAPKHGEHTQRVLEEFLGKDYHAN